MAQAVSCRMLVQDSRPVHVKFVVRKATLSQVFPCQHHSNSTQYVFTQTDPAARRLMPSGRLACLVWLTLVAAELPVIHWKLKVVKMILNSSDLLRRKQVRRHFGYCTVVVGSATSDSDRIHSAADYLAVSVSLCRQSNEIREKPRSRDCCV